MLHILVACKFNQDGNCYRMAGKKSLEPFKDRTAQCSMRVYSYKAKCYVVAYFYFIDWYEGKQRYVFTPDRRQFRMMLRAIGLDIR